MAPEKALPVSDAWENVDGYVDSLLDLIGNNNLLRTLCGGVHVLDFFTSDPDLYSRILPLEWRNFFARRDIMDILDLLLREDIGLIVAAKEDCWRNGPAPPPSLLDYVTLVREHLLNRDVKSSRCSRNRAMKPTQKMARHIAVGMNIKKVHEVGLFARYVSDLSLDISHTGTGEITHLVDFGSGQNYLGRALASEPYNKHIVAIESRSHNAERAKEFDVMARLATKQVSMVNKKAFRSGLVRRQAVPNVPTPPPEPQPNLPTTDVSHLSLDPAIAASPNAKGTIQYVKHRIQDGELSSVVTNIPSQEYKPPTLMIMSLHSCGNLVHHGLRSLVLNPSVKAVAMVGCCYNLLTERLGPATYKLPSLRPTTHDHPRLSTTGEANDPHGFPMSDRLCSYGINSEGIRLNITARMMAVQAPGNWGAKDSEAFFTRHFFRALLQKIFLDYGIVGPPSVDGEGGSPLGHSSGTPIVIGSLRKGCYATFTTYVRGALDKIYENSSVEQSSLFQTKMANLSDEDIAVYESDYIQRKKDLSVMWSLMAFSAGVVEAAIVVDRWLWLSEQREVAECWVESVFEYGLSPRNLVVVGVKK
ncbi:hypothetical protein LTR62_000523 [Meristemomyces frigidus]|uniref:Methyltransferase domain-containing protein n=1 Tax=Meristemomyces frigidus TaxID=1508187 RepID=A0AAN7YLJ2_9PEZI|nr:hypothetical protein LTR62_000523 [Meristemomyces frigidus]